MKNKDFLKHFGILGMRWGRRKSSSGGVTKSAPKKKEDVEDTPPAKKTRTGRVTDMTDQELKEAVARLQMEKQYRDLTKKELSQGRKIVNEMLTNSAKTAVGNALTGLMTKGLDKAIAQAAAKAAAKAVTK